MDAAALARAYGLASSFEDDGGMLEAAGFTIEKQWLSSGNKNGFANRYMPMEDGEPLTFNKVRWAVAVIEAWAISRKTGIKPHVPSIDLFTWKRRRRV